MNNEERILGLLETLVTKVDGLEQGQAAMQADITELKQDVSILKTDVTVLKNDVAVLKDDVSDIKVSLREAWRDIELLDKRI